MIVRQVYKRIKARKSQLTLFSGAAAVCFVATVVLAAQVFFKLHDFRTAFSDNTQWTVAKLEVEHAKYLHTLEHLEREDPATLADMNRRFDIFFSRVNTLATADNYRRALSGDRARTIIQTISDSVTAQADIIDAGTGAVFDNRETLMQMTQDLAQPVLDLSSIGITYDVNRREAQRKLLSSKLGQMALLSFMLLATLSALLALVWQLYSRYKRRAMQNRATLNRLATIINTSQDAIVVMSEDGGIIEGNRVAETIFGLKPGNTKTANISDFLRKKDDAGSLRIVTGEMLIKSCADGPNLCTKLSACDKSGRIFPVEMSANMAQRSGDDVCICFLRDISQRVENETEIRAARDKALAGEQAKARFLGMISHEMRTPLNGMLGALDLLDETALTREQSRYTQIMQSSGQLVLNQINDALEVTQAQGERLSLVSERFNLDALMHDLLTGQQTHALAQGNTITFAHADDILGEVLGDANRLHQVLLNLLSNAIKFTSNGEITVEVSRLGPMVQQSDEVEFQISDTGIGIEEDDLERIFEDFVRLEDMGDAEGTGLGLGIAKHLVALMGGTMGAESVRGEGSLFWVRVPLPRASDTMEAIHRTDLFPLPEMPLDVLVVEDNDTSRFVLNEMLQKDGHTVVLARDGAEGVTAAETRRFDVILMDVNMPEIDGIEATRLIRTGNGASKNSRIVALTAHFRPEHNERFRGVEIDSICTKPLRRAALRDILSVGRVRPHVLHEASDVDIQVLDQLYAVLPAQNLSRMLGEFLSEGQSFVDAIDPKSAMPSDELAADLHHFAGSAATFGAIALQRALCRAEAAALAGDKASLREELTHLPDLWRSTIVQIDNRRSAA